MGLTFEPIDLDRQHDYLALLNRCPQVGSDYSFINAWAWADEYGLQWAWDGELVWLRQSRPREAYWAPMGPWHEIDWDRRMEAGELAGRSFIRVPERLSEIWAARFGDRVRVEPARDHWDYVYLLSDLVELPGNRFHKKKNLLRQFEKSYDYTYAEFGPKLIEQALAMQEDWCTWRDCESSELLSSENQAIYRVLSHWQRFDRILGGALLVDGIIAAYTLAEPLTADSLVIHFEKGCPAFKGGYQAINQMFLAHAGGGYRFVNREQDLGNEGLRKAKESYNPVDYLRKSNVSFAG